jgi:hypothetical protein
MDLYADLHLLRQADCIQWIIETAPKQNPWSAERVIYELMAIWFGSVHILSTVSQLHHTFTAHQTTNMSMLRQTIVFVIHDLCLHPEYFEPLRRELESSYEEFERTGQGLPLLDSFIKESARLTPVESSRSHEPTSSLCIPSQILVLTMLSSERAAVRPAARFILPRRPARSWRMGVCTLRRHQPEGRILPFT